MNTLKRRTCQWAVCGLLAAGTPVLAAPLSVEYVDTSGREWASVAETTNLTANQFNAVCGTDGATACTGDIGAVETTGWTWATHDQVRDLFIDFGVPAAGLADYSHYEVDAPWAAAALAAFTPTTMQFGLPQLLGMTSTQNGGYVRLGNLLNRGPGLEDAIEIGPINYFDVPDSRIGAFLFREAPDLDPTPIPEPATGLLLLGGLAGLRLARRGRRRASDHATGTPAPQAR